MPYYEPPLIYLSHYAFELALLCKDALVSFRILQEGLALDYQRPSESETPEEREKFWINQHFAPTIRRIGLHSFVLAAANICNIIYPTIYRNDSDAIKERKTRRNLDFKKFFPSNSYPNLTKKRFRDFRVHFDERLDKIYTDKPNANTVSWTGQPSSLPTGDYVLIDDFDPATFNIMYYDKQTSGTETVNIKELREEINKIRLQLPEALAEITGTQPRSFNNLIEVKGQLCLNI